VRIGTGSGSESDHMEPVHFMGPAGSEPVQLIGQRNAREQV